MTLQGFVETINTNLESFGLTFLPSLFPLLAAALVLLIGFLVAKLFSFGLAEVSKILGLERTLQKISFYSNLLKTDKSLSLTNLVSQLIWWLTLLVFLITALQIAGFSATNLVLEKFAKFIPQLVEATLILVLGGLLVHLSMSVISVFGRLSQLPGTALISKASATVIIIFSSLQALSAVGASTEVVRFIVIGSVAAISLAVGLAAKDTFADIFKKFRNY